MRKHPKFLAPSHQQSSLGKGESSHTGTVSLHSTLRGGLCPLSSLPSRLESWLAAFSKMEFVCTHVCVGRADVTDMVHKAFCLGQAFPVVSIGGGLWVRVQEALRGE